MKGMVLLSDAAAAPFQFLVANVSDQDGVNVTVHWQVAMPEGPDDVEVEV